MIGGTWLLNTGANEIALPIYVTGASSAYVGMNILRPQGYQDHQLALCYAGSGYFSCGGVQTSIEPGTLFFFRQDVPHAYGPCGENWMLKWVAFSGTGSAAILDHLRYPDHSVFFMENPDTDDLFNQLATQWAHDQPFRAALLLQTLLAEALPHRVPAADQNRLNKVIHTMQTRYMECLSLVDLAAVHQSSASYLCRAFRSAFGTTPIEYLNRHRIAIAKTLLLDSRREIRDIAMATGFANPDYFCTAFKRWSGCSPTAFRERYGMKRMRKINVEL